MKSAAITIPGRAHDAYSAHGGVGSHENQRITSASPSRNPVDTNAVICRTAQQARSPLMSIGVAGFGPAIRPLPGRVKQVQQDQAPAAVQHPNMPPSLLPGLVRTPTPAEMRIQQLPFARLDEAALEAMSGRFTEGVRNLMKEIGEHQRGFESSAKNSVWFANAGYGLFRLGMKLGDLCRAWLRRFHDDQGLAPTVDSMAATVRGVHQVGQKNWLPALQWMEGVVMRQPRFRDAIQQLGRGAEAMAAHYLGQVGHLPNTYQFRQEIAQAIGQLDIRGGSLDKATQLERQQEVCLHLIDTTRQWMARSGEFLQAEKAPPALDLVKGAAEALARGDTRAAVREFGASVGMNPGYEIALWGLMNSAQTLVDKIEKEREAIHWANYSRHMDQRDAFIDAWTAAARSPEVNG